MSQQANSIFTLAVTAAAPIAAYRGVNFNGVMASGLAYEKIVGISKRAANTGQELEVAVLGTATCEAGAAFPKGTALAMDAQGRVVAARGQIINAPAIAAALAVAAGAVAVTSAAANGAIIAGTGPSALVDGGDPYQFIIGHALEAAVNIGDFVEVILAR